MSVAREYEFILSLLINVTLSLSLFFPVLSEGLGCVLINNGIGPTFF